MICYVGKIMLVITIVISESLYTYNVGTTLTILLISNPASPRAVGRGHTNWDIMIPFVIFIVQ